jgi:hypothetical protein
MRFCGVALVEFVGGKRDEQVWGERVRSFKLSSIDIFLAEGRTVGDPDHHGVGAWRS